MLNFKTTNTAYKNKLNLELDKETKEIEISINSLDAQKLIDLIKIEKPTNEQDLEASKLLLGNKYDEVKNLLDQFNFNSLIQMLATDFLVKVGEKRLESIKLVSMNPQKNIKK